MALIKHAIRLLGLGKDQCHRFAGQQSMVVYHPKIPFARAFAAQFEPLPTIVLLQAGDLNMGSYDPFAE